MHVTREESESPVPVLRLEGDFDAFETEDLRQELAKLLAEGHATSIMNLAPMNFANSTTIACFISAQQRARGQGGEIVFAAPQEFFLKTLQTLGLDEIFPIFETMDAAQAHVAS